MKYAPILHHSLKSKFEKQNPSYSLKHSLQKKLLKSATLE